MHERDGQRESWSVLPTWRMRILVWVIIPVTGALSLWGYLEAGAGQDKFRNAVVLSCLGVVMYVVLEVRHRLRR